MSATRSHREGHGPQAGGLPDGPIDTGHHSAGGDVRRIDLDVADRFVEIKLGCPAVPVRAIGVGESVENEAGGE